MDETSGITLTERQAAVLRTVRRQQCPTAAEVAFILRIAPSTARATLMTLAKRGLVRQGGTSSTNATAWLIAEDGTP